MKNASALTKNVKKLEVKMAHWVPSTAAVSSVLTSVYFKVPLRCSVDLIQSTIQICGQGKRMEERTCQNSFGIGTVGSSAHCIGSVECWGELWPSYWSIGIMLRDCHLKHVHQAQLRAEASVTVLEKWVLAIVSPGNQKAGTESLRNSISILCWQYAGSVFY